MDKTPKNFFILKQAKWRLLNAYSAGYSYTFTKGINLTTSIASVGNNRETSKRSHYRLFSFCLAESLRSREGKGGKTQSACEARKKSEKAKSKELFQIFLEKMCLL